MMAMRFDMPRVGEPSSVTFPHVERRLLSNGLRVWAIQHSAVPVVTVSCLLEAGTAIDPAAKHGLASLTAALVAEGAGQYDAIALSDVLARIGGHLATEVGTDVATVSLTVLARHFDRGLSILADIVRRPTMLPPDFDRVRDLRLSRLKQLARMPATAADRVLLQAVYGNHPYGHGSLGTTRSVQAMTLDDVRECWTNGWQPTAGALLVAGDISPEHALASCESAFGDWTTSALPAASVPAPDVVPVRDIRVVNWPGAAQSEIRVGHAGPPRRTAHYHALVALNAILGGQFTSRINRNLREARAITYGARTSFDMRRAGGLFSCDSSVQTDATAVALAEVVREIREIGGDGAISFEELDNARAALTRGYVRYFETAGQLARAMAELAAYGLDDDTYDRFVREIGRLTPADLTDAAAIALHPDETSLVVTGDLEKIGDQLLALDRPLLEVVPEF
jgi:zinc protease